VPFILAEEDFTPIITTEHPDANNNKYGFEGGRVIQTDGQIHLFTSEMVDDPKWVKMRLGHWASEDGLNWHRVGTVRESSGDYTGSDPRAAMWSPMPIYNDDEQRWNLFYVAYSCEPNTITQFRNNYDGHIWRAVSETGTINGPYVDMSVVMQPDDDSGDWEGLQGVDSFFPYQTADGTWLAFYGSANTESLPIRAWLVGLARGESLAGPWTRMHDASPVKIEETFIENPVVTQLRDDLWIALYDTQTPYAIGYSISADGQTWGKGQYLRLPSIDKWTSQIRTPLGLVSTQEHSYQLYFTAYRRSSDQTQDEIVPDGDGAVGVVTVKWEDD